MKKITKLTAVLLSALIILSACSSSDDKESGDTGPVVNTSASGDYSYLYTPPFFYSESLTDEGFYEGLRALDYVTMFDYENFHIPVDIHTVSDEALQNEINDMLSYFPASEKIYDRPVEDGEYVNIDYVGSIDGVEFEGGNSFGMGSEVLAGSDQFIDDFLTQIIGRMPGETFDVHVTFPDVYHSEELAGKPALFVTTINYIVGDSIPAVFNDEFVMDNLNVYYGWTTAEEARAGLADQIRERAVGRYTWDYLATEVPISSMPDVVRTHQERRFVEYITGLANDSNVELNTYIAQQYGVPSFEEYLQLSPNDVETESRIILVLQAIAEDAGMTITERDLEEYFFAYTGTMDYSQFEPDYGIGYLKQLVMHEKISEMLSNNVVYG